MASSPTFSCPTCSQVLSLPAGFQGSQVQCPKCQTNIQVPSTQPAAAPVAAQTLVQQPVVQQTAPVNAPVLDAIGKISIDMESTRGSDTETRRLFQAVTKEVGKIFVGQDELVVGSLVALFSGGHVLLSLIHI